MMMIHNNTMTKRKLSGAQSVRGPECQGPRGSGAQRVRGPECQGPPGLHLQKVTQYTIYSILYFINIIYIILDEYYIDYT